ncbi:MAG: D-glutamate deacylase, partial [Gammaproteobacteria bacterium]|nr:D-glutamate deacylase [Gammaproteobacteria bacterium]
MVFFRTQLVFSFLLICLAVPLSGYAEIRYSVVLAGGRVVDPESGLDAIRHVGLQDGRIVRISEQPLEGDEVIDVSSLVVSPGFIDIHSHTPTPLGQDYQVRDGVTTALELEAGAFPVDRFGQYLQQGSRMNFGASAAY